MLIRLAWRSLWRNRRRTLITLTAISLALTLAVFFIAFADGVYAKMIDDAVRMQAGHLTLEHPAYRTAPAVDLVVKIDDELRASIERLPQVDCSKALVVGQGVARSGLGATGVLVLGVEPHQEAATSPLVHKIVAGEYLEDSSAAEAVVGLEMARLLALGGRRQAEQLVDFYWPLLDKYPRPRAEWVEKLRPYLAVGKKLVVSTNDRHGHLVEELVRVKGIFSIGAVEIDGYLLQLPIDFARRLYGLEPQEANQLGVVLSQAGALARVQQRLRQMIGGVAVPSWKEVLPDLATYIEVDGGSNVIFQAIFFVLVLFVIFNTILMSVLERRREWAVLLALGTTPARLRGQIALESAVLALLGCAVGLLLGGALAYWMEVAGLDLRIFYPEGIAVSGVAIEPIIHARLTWQLLVVCGLVVFLSTMLVSLYPMRQIRRIRVAEVLKG